MTFTTGRVWLRDRIQEARPIEYAIVTNCDLVIAVKNGKRIDWLNSRLYYLDGIVFMQVELQGSRHS